MLREQDDDGEELEAIEKAIDKAIDKAIEKAIAMVL
jgi:hypothetical protein